MNDASRIGWIGLGRMGSAMATRLLESDHEVLVTNRTREKAENLAKIGAEVAESPSDLAVCDVVFVTVSADADLVEVTSGPKGVLSNPHQSPGIMVDCSTVSMAASATVRQACEARNTALLAAPVSGNARVVSAGQLSFCVSGAQDAYETVRQLL